MPDDSMRTVLVALGSGLAVALAKVGVAVVTGSSAMAADPGVTALREVLVTFTGPGRAWVTARLDIADDLSGANVKSLVRGIESGMKRESEAVYRVDVVPIGRA